MLGEFTTGTTQTWYFLFWKVIDFYSISLIDKAFGVFCVFLCEFSRLCLLRYWSVSSRLSSLWAQSSYYFFIILFMSMSSVVISPVSLLILVINVPSLSYLAWFRGISVLSIFSKNQHFLYGFPVFNFINFCLNSYSLFFLLWI